MSRYRFEHDPAWSNFMGGSYADGTPVIWVASGLKLLVREQTEPGCFWVALEISKLAVPGIELVPWHAHITIGTYRVVADPSRKRIATDQRAHNVFDAKIREAKREISYWSRFTPTLMLQHNRYCSLPGPHVFDLRLCPASFALDRLSSRLEASFSGVFQCMGEPRTMIYLQGPTLHLSLYGVTVVELPPLIAP
jgi:hypothetical protein